MPRIVPVLMLFVAALAARAQDVPSAEDAIAVQAVIADQLDAFNRDDGQAAWSHAAPGIQGKFQSVEIFMEMVRSAYGPIHRSANAEFGTLHGEGDRLVQELVVTGQDGTTALAVYTLGRQPDGSWKIEGVTLEPLPDLTA